MQRYVVLYVYFCGLINKVVMEYNCFKLSAKQYILKFNKYVHVAKYTHVDETSLSKTSIKFKNMFLLPFLI